MNITSIPDPFLVWLWKYSTRTLAACAALGIIAFLLSLVFRALALMVDALHGVLHSVHVFCMSVNQAYLESGILGQLLICLISLLCLGWIIYRGGSFLYHSYRQGRAS